MSKHKHSNSQQPDPLASAVATPSGEPAAPDAAPAAESTPASPTAETSPEASAPPAEPPAPDPAVTTVATFKLAEPPAVLPEEPLPEILEDETAAALRDAPPVIVPTREQVIKAGYSETAVDRIIAEQKALRAAQSRAKGLLVKPGLRLLVKRATSFWCIGQELVPGIAKDVPVEKLTKVQLLEIGTVKDKFISVEEIEIEVEDEPSDGK